MTGSGSTDQSGERHAFAPGTTGADSTAGSTEGSTDQAAGWYGIAVAAARAGVHEQTLRHYERLGLIAPARKGTRPRSPRLYSERDIERVVHIRRLMGDLGVNLAGVEIILSMRERMEGLQRELRQLRREQVERGAVGGNHDRADPRAGGNLSLEPRDTAFRR